MMRHETTWKYRETLMQFRVLHNDLHMTQLRHPSAVEYINGYPQFG